MHPEDPAGAEVEGWLTALGVETVCQWDVLVFLYRHPTSLVGADHVARLLGYDSDRVVAALDVLAFLRLVTRSRMSQGARLYQFTAPPEPPPSRRWSWFRPVRPPPRVARGPRPRPGPTTGARPPTGRAGRSRTGRTTPRT